MSALLLGDTCRKARTSTDAESGLEACSAGKTRADDDARDHGTGQYGWTCDKKKHPPVYQRVDDTGGCFLWMFFVCPPLQCKLGIVVCPCQQPKEAHGNSNADPQVYCEDAVKE